MLVDGKQNKNIFRAYAFGPIQLRLCVKVCKCRPLVLRRARCQRRLHSIFYLYLSARDVFDSNTAPIESRASADKAAIVMGQPRDGEAGKKQKWAIFSDGTSICVLMWSVRSCVRAKEIAIRIVGFLWFWCGSSNIVLALAVSSSILCLMFYLVYRHAREAKLDEIN